MTAASLGPDFWQASADEARRAAAPATEERKSHEARAVESIAALLAAYGPLTYKEIAKRTNTEINVVCWRMKALRDANRIRVVTVDGFEDSPAKKRGGGRLIELGAPRKRSIPDGAQELEDFRPEYRRPR